MDIENFCLPMVIKIPINVYVLQIIVNDGDGAQILPREKVTHIPTINTDTIITLDWILRFLVIHLIFSSLVIMYENVRVKRVYGLTPL
eukprot:Gb_31985 [translate_table: standard]